MSKKSTQRCVRWHVICDQWLDNKMVKGHISIGLESRVKAVC